MRNWYGFVNGWRGFGRRWAFALASICCLPATAHAQTPIAPSGMTFTATGADVAKTLSYRLDFFQCASVTAGAGVGCAAAPFQTGVDVPKVSITSAGTTRTLPLTTAPANGLLAATPAGVPMIATLIANGDPAQGASNSPRSSASNAFFGRALAVSAPSAVTVIQ